MAAFRLAAAALVALAACASAQTIPAVFMHGGAPLFSTHAARASCVDGDGG